MPVAEKTKAEPKAKVRYFKVVRGDHTTPTRFYDRGDVVPATEDLSKRFPGKFSEVGGPEDKSGPQNLANLDRKGLLKLAEDEEIEVPETATTEDEIRQCIKSALDSR